MVCISWGVLKKMPSRFELESAVDTEVEGVPMRLFMLLTVCKISKSWNICTHGGWSCLGRYEGLLRSDDTAGCDDGMDPGEAELTELDDAMSFCGFNLYRGLTNILCWPPKSAIMSDCPRTGCGRGTMPLE